MTNGLVGTAIRVLQDLATEFEEAGEHSKAKDVRESERILEARIAELEQPLQQVGDVGWRAMYQGREKAIDDFQRDLAAAEAKLRVMGQQLDEKREDMAEARKRIAELEREQQTHRIALVKAHDEGRSEVAEWCRRNAHELWTVDAKEARRMRVVRLSDLEDEFPVIKEKKS